LNSPSSYTKQFILRLLKNRRALFGFIIIAASVFIALFAYFIAPDSTTDANTIIPEIANKKVGFTISFLRIKKELHSSNTLVQRFWQGEEAPYNYLPVHSYSIVKDSVFAMKYLDDNVYESVYFAKKQLAKNAVISKTFLLGTDKFGRDLLSRLIIGTRISLGVGFIAVFISLTIGIFLGAIGGYYGGKTDRIIIWLINVTWSMPTLLLVFAITLLLGKGFWQIFIAVGLTMWVNVARLVRGQVLGTREMEYIEAARALGFSNNRIIFKHILPNIIGPVMVIAASNFASAILVEAGLSFLGIGVQPPQASWGLMIRENYNFIITNNPLPAIEPGIAIFLLVLAFNMLGNGLRDVLDVK